MVVSAWCWAILSEARVVRTDRQPSPLTRESETQSSKAASCILLGRQSSTKGQGQVLSCATQTLRLWGDDRPRQAPLIRRGADCRVALQAFSSELH